MKELQVEKKASKIDLEKWLHETAAGRNGFMKELRVEKKRLQKLAWRNGFMKQLRVEKKTSKDLPHEKCWGLKKAAD